VSSEFNESNYSSKMDKTILSLKKDISTLRTGRANTSMLDTIKVDVYGQLMPIDQLGTISVPEARLISIQVWDKINTPLIDSAIQKSELGINPQIDGQTIRLRIPDLTEERRKDLIKVLKNMGEKGKIAIRNIRREANEDLKKKLKDKVITEDDNKNFEKNIQKLTDVNIENIDKILTEKEKNYSLKMNKSILSLKKDISTLRTGRANTNMLDTIKVDVYGQLMPIDQLATISVPEARLISIQVWDKTNTPLIDSAIQKSDLGINPQIDGQFIRLRIPDLTEERRKDLIKILKNMGEKGKISIRNIRREANEDLKKN